MGRSGSSGGDPFCTPNWKSRYFSVSLPFPVKFLQGAPGRPSTMAANEDGEDLSSEPTIGERAVLGGSGHVPSLTNYLRHS